MARHTFSFDGGEMLTTMGAAWFVSYSYHRNIDSFHSNWRKVSTANNRASVFNRTQSYHIFWLRQVLLMNDDNINKNTIGLKAKEIKEMTKKLLN